MIYLPLAQDYNDAMTLHLWTGGEPGQLAGPVRDVVNSIDANVTPYATMAMAAHLRYGLAFVPVRLAAAIASGIGLVGLVLAIVGLYGVIAYSVAQRHREIGIRMALGATSADILRGVLREGMVVTAAGLAAGLALALSTTRVLGSLLIDVGARDPATFVVLAAGLVCVAVVACAVPAWRASTIPPAQVVKD
jgi:cell division protein FtsX